jgi:hypothetical protein
MDYNTVLFGVEVEDEDIAIKASKDSNDHTFVLPFIHLTKLRAQRAYGANDVIIFFFTDPRALNVFQIVMASLPRVTAVRLASKEGVLRLALKAVEPVCLKQALHEAGIQFEYQSAH